jgi:hypothetical protein
VTRPRAADDFASIHQRIEELRGDGAVPPAEDGPAASAGRPLTDHEKRREGHPPSWVPTIFIKKPTNLEIARRFWRAGLG